MDRYGRIGSNYILIDIGILTRDLKKAGLKPAFFVKQADSKILICCSFEVYLLRAGYFAVAPVETIPIFSSPATSLIENIR